LRTRDVRCDQEAGPRDEKRAGGYSSWSVAWPTFRFFERWGSTCLSRLGSMDSADVSQVLYFSGTGDEKEARRCMSPRLPTLARNKGAKVGHPAPALVDRKRHTVGSLARRVAAAAIGTAWGAAARVGHRDLRHASSGNVCSGDHDAKRVRHRVGRVGLRRSVPIHHCVPVKVAAGDRQGETRTTVKLAGRHDCRNDRNNAGLCHLVRATVPAAKGCQS